MRILMVCLGNICRSPIAEGVLRQKIHQNKLNWTVSSAGTESYHTGSPPHRSSQKICQAHGIDISEQRARKFTLQDFDAYDKIYALAEDVYEEIKRIGGPKANMNKVDFLLNELHDDCNASVPDPWYGGEEGYLPVFKMIEQACEAIVRKYAPAH